MLFLEPPYIIGHDICFWSWTKSNPEEIFGCLLYLSDSEPVNYYNFSNLIFPLIMNFQSTFIVDEMNNDATIKWMSEMFDAQERFSTSATLNKTDEDVMK